jgi:hypothetical protein
LGKVTLQFVTQANEDSHRIGERRSFIWSHGIHQGFSQMAKDAVKAAMLRHQVIDVAADLVVVVHSFPPLPGIHQSSQSQQPTHRE